MCVLSFFLSFFWRCPHFSVLELVDAAIPAELLDPMKQTIVQVEGVKVSGY